MVKKAIWRNILLFVANIVILSTLTTLESLGLLLAINVGVFYAGKALIKNPHRKWIKPTLISALIGLFVVKNYHIVEIDLLQRVGLSYILFRQIHFILESAKGTIKRLSPLTFVNYILFFPSFMAGPIDTYNNFAYWVSNTRFARNGGLVKTGVGRIFIGVAKKFMLVPIIAPYATDFALLDVHFSWQISLALSLVLYSFYILLDFSGYSDIAIGTAYLMGIKTPENFNNPYIANNLSDFWKRWHMTFSNFLLSYIFKPTVKGLSRFFPSAKRLTISFLGYIITFAICGIWHGPTLNFLYWGLWHGLFLYLYKLWDKYVVPMPREQLTINLKNKVHNVIGMGITFIVVTLGWFLFNYNTDSIHFILTNLGNSSPKHVEVETVSFKKKPLIKLSFPENTKYEIANVSVSFKESTQDQTFEIDTLLPDTMSDYYMATAIKSKGLMELNIQVTDLSGQVEAFSILHYVYNNQFYPNQVQATLFGANTRSEVVNVDPVLINKANISLPQDFTPKLNSEVKFIPDYGYAIQLNYEPYDLSEIEIAYKFNNEDWVTATDNRPGNYNFYHIHGNSLHNGLSRNVGIGNYEYRLRYKIGLMSTKWYYGKKEVSRYE